MTDRPVTPMQPRTRESVRTHLRIATCYNLLMREAARRHLVEPTLPQFDVLAELARADAGGFFLRSAVARGAGRHR